MKTLAILSLMFGYSCFTAHAQESPSHTEDYSRQEELAGRLEEIAMCHHAIRAAYHDGLALNQNPYYRYILNSPQSGHRQNVYPIPERCKTIETSLILDYTQMSTESK